MQDMEKDIQTQYTLRQKLGNNHKNLPISQHFGVNRFPWEQHRFSSYEDFLLKCVDASASAAFLLGQRPASSITFFGLLVNVFYCFPTQFLIFNRFLNYGSI
uniref:Uncharacterized protein n=1 Tax=Glossina brevipalpis TaxID=37001 RepID=A0A1A9WUN6_9MUSC